MTKKQKYSLKNRFNEHQSVEEDIELADLEVSLDDTEITPVPLNNYLDDEEIIDTLLVDKYANTSADTDQELDTDKIVEDVDLIDEDDGSTQFNIGPVDDDEEVVIEPSTFFDESYSKQDTRELYVEPDEIQINTDNGQLKQDPNADIWEETNVIEDLIESELLGSVEPISTKLANDNGLPTDAVTQQQPLTEAELNANEKALLLIKQALLADNSFIASVGSQVRPAKVQKKNPTPQVQTESYASRKKTIYSVLAGLLLTILLALAIKVFLLSAQVSKLQALTSILEEDVSILHEKKAALEAESNRISSEAIPQSGQTSVNVERPKPEDVTQRPETVNAFHEVSKPLEHKVELKKTVKLPASPKHPALDNRTSEKDLTKTSKNAVIKSAWVVNVVAFKAQNEAKKKSAKLIAQGIPVKISSFNAKNTQWYQLRVNGFKNKEAAQSYANKIKKSLDLKSITIQSN